MIKMQLGVKTVDEVADYLTKKYQITTDESQLTDTTDYKNTQQFKNMQWLIVNCRSLMKLYGRETLPDEQLDTRSFREIAEELMLDNASPWKFDSFVNELRSVAATTAEILNFVRHGLIRYKFYCQLSGNEKLHQQCRILWKYYIAPSNESQKSLRRKIIYEENLEKSYLYILLNDSIASASKFVLN
jgi:hypothetical protein